MCIILENCGCTWMELQQTNICNRNVHCCFCVSLRSISRARIYHTNIIHVLTFQWLVIFLLFSVSSFHSNTLSIQPCWKFGVVEIISITFFSLSFSFFLSLQKPNVSKEGKALQWLLRVSSIWAFQVTFFLPGIWDLIWHPFV